MKVELAGIKLCKLKLLSRVHSKFSLRNSLKPIYLIDKLEVFL